MRNQPMKPVMVLLYAFYTIGHMTSHWLLSTINIKSTIINHDWSVFTRLALMVEQINLFPIYKRVSILLRLKMTDHIKII